MLSHYQNRQTSTGHVKQSLADNMFAYCKLVELYGYTQVIRICIYCVFRLGL